MRGFADPFLGLNPNFGYGAPKNTPIIQPSKAESKILENEEVTINDVIVDDEEIVDLQYIVKNKPKTKIVREFMKYNLSLIKSEEDKIFEV